jgi:hypothetical protein
LAALGFQWRETTADAIYGQGGPAVPGTAGHGTQWTGVFLQSRAAWQVDENLALALETVHFQVGDSIRILGACNPDYVGMEAKFGW